MQTNLDVEPARHQMIYNQIRPWDVSDDRVLATLAALPRERFVPEEIQGIAYNDEDLPIGGGRFLLEPITHAKMVQAVKPGPEDVVLDIGGATGYSAAILSSLVTTVIALDNDETYLKQAQNLWNDLSVCNVVPITGDLTQGNPENAPFSLIFMNGSVPELPEQLAGQLTPDGRLITIIRKPGDILGQVTLVQNLGGGQFSSYNMFSAGSPYLPGFEPKPSFTF